MAGTSWDQQGEVRAALQAIVSDPQYGVSALSSTRTMSNLLKDFLPDRPREAGVLIAASEADLAGTLQTYVAQGLDPSTAQRLVATSFAERSAMTPDACTWVVSELAIALGLAPGDAAPPAGTARFGGSSYGGVTRPGRIPRPGDAAGGTGWAAATPNEALPTAREPATGTPTAGAPGWGTPADPNFPTVGPGQQAYGSGQPAYGPGQPTYGPGQLGFDPGQVGYGAGQPGHGLGQQLAGQGQPGQGQPGQGQPGQGQPGYGAAQQVFYPGQEYVPAPASASKRTWIVGASAAVVALAVIAVVLVVIKHGPASTPTTAVGLATSVPASTLSAVGAGQTYSSPIQSISGPALTIQGKPELLYIGATFCPYCAANQWSMIVALSRFGTFTGLHSSRSAPRPEVFPNTATLTFYGAAYSSNYLDFVSVENETVTRTPLQPTTSQEQTIWHRYSDGSFPFLDFGNKFESSSLFDPKVLQGKTQRQIAAALSKPTSSIAQAVDGGANLVTAAICEITNEQPGSVCDTDAISTIQNGL